MIITQGSQETGFSPISMYTCLQCITNSTSIQLRVRGFSQEFIANGDLVKKPAIQCIDESVISCPILRMKILNRLVIPGYHGFIRGEFLVIPIHPEILAETFINTFNVGLPGRSLLTGDRKPCI